jgi:phosphate starvation-inducible PhoH-like protein
LVRKYKDKTPKQPIDITQTKKKFHPKDLQQIQPLTDNQETFFNSFKNTENHFFLSGSAGTGKSTIALWHLLNDTLSNKYDKLVIIRGATQVNNLGFTPGTVEEKLEPYEAPYKNIFDDFFTFKKSYDNLKENRQIEFMSSSFIRGMNLNSCAIFIDEVQSLTYHEIFSILTRTGLNSRVIMAGDFRQNDLQYKKYVESGFLRLEKVVEKIPSILTIHFDRDDIVRSDFVKQLIIADEDTPHD